MGNWFMSSIHKWIQWLMVRLLGKSNDTLFQDQWSGRLMYIKKEIAASTKKTNDALQLVRQDLRDDEKHMADFRNDLDCKMKELQEQIVQLLEMKGEELEVQKQQTV